MMLGEGFCPVPAIHVPPWPTCEDPEGEAAYAVLPVSGVASGNGSRGEGEFSPYLLGEAALAALQRFLPFNEGLYAEDDSADDSDLSDPPVDAYSCDEFRMYEFKVRRCARGRSHDWTECPYAHPGEKARRRDPRKFHYSGTPCPDFRKGSCKKGDACEYAHGVFECWLHPSRYRTQPCKDGINCRRRVCFFAHTPEQLRVLSPTQQQHPLSPDAGSGSPMRRNTLGAYFSKSLISSPTSTLISPPISPPYDSPPLSPTDRSLRRPSVATTNEVLASLRHLHLNNAKPAPSSWGRQFPGLVSPSDSSVRPGFGSVPTTPTRKPCVGLLENWSEPTERVESGRDLRVKFYEKLSMEIAMGRGDGDDDGGGNGARDSTPAAPDVGWVSDLLQ